MFLSAPTNMTPDEVRQIIREELQTLIGTDRYMFQKTLQLFDGRNIQVGRGTGTKVGTGTDQKLGFYNKTPIVQPSAIAAPSSAGGTYNQAVAQSTVDAINLIRTALTNLGLTA